MHALCLTGPLAAALLTVTPAVLALSVPPGVTEWAQDQHLTPGPAFTSRTSGDRITFTGTYRVPGVTATVRVVFPTSSGQAPVSDSLHTDFPQLSGTRAATRLLLAYRPEDAVQTLTPGRVTACLREAAHAPGRAVRTLLEVTLDRNEGRSLKVTCGVNAAGFFLTALNSVPHRAAGTAP